MKCRSILDREPLLLLCSLAAATCLVGSLVVLRLIATSHASYGFLAWNTFLAWLPIVFAIAWARASEMRRGGWKAIALAGAWLLFLPNAPYLLTDTQHFNSDGLAPRWYDSLLFGANALNGIMLGAAALAIGHRTLERAFGTTRAWATIVVVCLLCGFGVYLGRFVRLNSWDVFTDPVNVARVILDLALAPFHHGKAWFFTLVAGAVQLLCYLTLRGYAALQRAAALADFKAALA